MNQEKLGHSVFEHSKSFPVLAASELDFEKLHTRYIAQGTPVLVRNAHSIRWTWDVYRDSYDGAFVDVAVTPTGYYVLNNYCEDDIYLDPNSASRAIPEAAVFRRRLPIDELVARITQPGLYSPLVADGEKLYLYASKLPAQLEKLLTLPPCLSHLGEPRVWASMAGVNTSLHCDVGPNYLLQVKGEKRFVMFPAAADLYEFPIGLRGRRSRAIKLREIDPEEYPNFFESPCWEGVLFPGDLIVMPSLAWHYVETISPSISVRVGDEDLVELDIWKNLLAMFGHEAGVLWNLSQNERTAMIAKMRGALDENCSVS